jgi:hypothetical protein
MVPAQRPDLFGPQAREQGQDDVRLQPRPFSRGHQRDGLLQGQRLRRPPSCLPLRRIDQRGDGVTQPTTQGAEIGSDLFLYVERMTGIEPALSASEPDCQDGLIAVA